MRAIVDAALSEGDAIRQATSVYIDDVFIDENLVSAARVRQYLVSLGLVNKKPVRLQDGVHVVGKNFFCGGVQHAEMGM